MSSVFDLSGFAQARLSSIGVQDVGKSYVLTEVSF